MSLVKLTNISKKYGNDENATVVLKNINLNIDKGEMIAIMGPSGSGKSTLLSIIGTLLHPDSGSYMLEDKDIYNLKDFTKLRNNFFGFVVQNYALIDNYTVEQNIELPLIYSGKNKIQRKAIVKELLTKLGMLEKRYKLPCQLSGGQCQRVAVARAIANNPKIILADEPTGSLDILNGNQIMEIFTELNKQGTTIVIVTHNQDIAKCCNRVIRLKDGSIE